MRHFLLLFCLLLASPCFAGWNPYVVGSGVVASSGPPVGVTYWWTANSADDTKDYGDAPTITGTVDYVTGQVGNAMRTNTFSEYVGLPNGTLSGTSGKVGFWFRGDTSISDNTNILYGNSNFYIVVASSGRIAFLYSGSYQYSANSTIVADTWYWIEAKWDITGGNLNSTLYVNNTSVATVSTAKAAIDLSAVSVKIGHYDQANTNYLYIDNVIVGGYTTDIYSYRNTDGI